MAHTLAECRKQWQDECEAGARIKENYGLEKALEYLIRGKLACFLERGKEEPVFLEELPNLVSAIQDVFERHEIETYLKNVTHLRPYGRRIRKLLMTPLKPRLVWPSRSTNNSEAMSKADKAESDELKHRGSTVHICTNDEVRSMLSDMKTCRAGRLRSLAREAKAIVANSLLGGHLEALQSGRRCPMCAGKSSFAHLTQDDIRPIIKQAVSAVYRLLCLRDETPNEFQRQIDAGSQHTDGWDDPENLERDVAQALG